jgi:hypothetical protein
VTTPSDPQSVPNRRLAALTGRLLEQTLDEELQALVSEAARAFDTPIALVSILLGRIQFFRAFHGLPQDLALVRATARDTSLCQFVVRDGEPFEVEDVAADPTLPRELAERYGIRSYLGVPVRIDGEIAGTLCIIDIRPRRFGDTGRDRLRTLADRVQTRLSRLAASRTPTPLGLIEAAVAPVFAELRNELGPIRYGIEGARAATLDLNDLLQACESETGPTSPRHDLRLARRAITALGTQFDAIDEAAIKLLGGIKTLENAATTALIEPKLADVITEASALSRHMTQIIGGVWWTPPETDHAVALPLPIASALLAALLSWLTDCLRTRRLPGPIRAYTHPATDGVAVAFTVPGLIDEDLEAVRRRFERLGIDPLVRLETDLRALRIVLPTLDALPATASA